MGKNRKSLLLVIAAICATTGAIFGLSACNKSEKTDDNLLSMQDVYAKAQELGFEGSLEELIAMFKGAQGAQGEKGETGAQGAQGEKGEKGDTGAQGEKGEKGDTGAQGEKGVGVADVEIDEDGKLVIILTDGTKLSGVDLPDATKKEENESGLHFMLSAEKDSYSVVDLGMAESADIVIPNSYKGLPVTSIGDNAFANCNVLTSVTIPNSITSIGGSAFYGCSDLTSVTLSNSLVSIGKKSFYGCSGLASVTIPESVTSIGDNAFDYCNKLENIYITDIAAWCNIDGLWNLLQRDNDLFNSDSCNKLYLNNDLITDLVLPDGIISIAHYAFYGCISLASVTIPDSVTSIGEGTFIRCCDLSKVKIGKGVTSIGGYAFSFCDKLENIYITDIAAWCKIDGLYALLDRFKGWLDTTDNCNKLYLNNDLITNLVLPDGIISVADYAFYNCSSLTSVTIPDSVTSIGDSAFSGCNGLTSVTIPDSVTSIGLYAFYNCSSLTSVTIPDSVTSIGRYAFSGCSGLMSVTIGMKVTLMYSNTFINCYKLVEVINKSKLKIDKGTFPINEEGDGVEECYVLTVHNGTSKIVEVDNYQFITADGVNYLLGYKGTETELTLPTNYNGQNYKIYNYAFENRNDLTSVTIGSGAISIGEGAFKKCANLASVTIFDKVTSIGQNAFSACAKLARINFFGTKAQWNSVSKGNQWNLDTGNYTIYCTDNIIGK